MLTNAAIVVALTLLGVEAGPVSFKNGQFSWTPTRHAAYPPDVVDKLLDSTMPKVAAWMATKKNANNCTLENAAVRREWSDLSIAEREDYIKAVLCLQSKPGKAPKETAPGVRSRFDDFVATHMTQAMMLHDPTHLFASHKYYIWLYEQALRNECGYKGYQPYMNYDRYAQDPENSPLFNGNATSMSGQGEPDSYLGVPQPFRAPYNRIPPGGGGGCVKDGPFKDMVVSLGPAGTIVSNIPKNPRPDTLGSNPRCLRRDINRNSALGATANYTLQLINEYPDINGFYNRYLGQPQLKGDAHPWGLHNGGHYIIGGDPGGDFFASPGDPAFYFHHGMLDRVWWIWQMQDPEKRVPMIPGQFSMGMGGMGHQMTKLADIRPEMSPKDIVEQAKRNANWKRQEKSQGDVIIDLGWTGGPVPIKDLNDQLGGIGGEMCYIYV